MRYVRVSLPEQVASELIDDGFAVPPVDLRNSAAFEIAGYVVDGINTAQATVTLIMTGVALRKLAQRTLARVRRAKDAVTIDLTVRGEKFRFEEASSSEDLEDRLLAFLVENLEKDNAQG